MKEENKKSFRILSIDGGGIRGLIPAVVLAEVEKHLQKDNSDKRLHEHFDLICGTSTGAILGIAIALGIPEKNLVEFYKENAEMIFPKWYLKVIPRKARVFVTSIYSNKKLRRKLEEIFKAANNDVTPTLYDLKTNVCVPSFNGNTGSINVLKTKHHKDYLRDFMLPAHEVALSSASAPIYFPPHSFSFNNEHGSGSNVNMIDGGIFANNPTLIGLLEATDKLGYDFGEIEILSLGTGRGKHIIKSHWLPKQFFYWFIPKPRLLDIILDSQSQITEQYLLFLKRFSQRHGNDFGYMRVQYDLGSDTIDLNASSKTDIRRLEGIGNELTKQNLNEILQFLKIKQ
ncbi:CBASS cGAMP-activated phospholipase [Siphonobacter sp. SORGH_AS_0500]|uniref:CBASS cGAMP-activated phospholipase n=1 Tax=Siphonobacter sp. SORGH_AS_0500 TaxID=1864824 RepID=UPI0012FEE9CE|nr:CBASS cGAMP-activated phospholipase [Siphonobacter sp. SORGH_AS_0500]